MRRAVRSVWAVALVLTAVAVPVATQAAGSPPPVINPYAGDAAGAAGNSGDGGPAGQARFDFPAGLAMDAQGRVYIADNVANRVRRVERDGKVSHVAGRTDGSAGDEGDGGPATDAALRSPDRLAFTADGSLLIADSGNHRIRRIDTDGIMRHVAGDPAGTPGNGGDGGPAATAALHTPRGVAVGPDGTIYVADFGNHRVRAITSDGTIRNFAGSAGAAAGDSGNGGPATEALLTGPADLLVSPAGDVYVSDWSAHRVRVVRADGTIHLVAGVQGGGNGVDGRPAVDSRLNLPSGLAFDGAGGLFIADHDNNRVRRVDAGGVITTLAGHPNSGWGNSGDGGPAASALLDHPAGLLRTPTGELLVADSHNHRVRVVSFPTTFPPATLTVDVVNQFTGAPLPGHCLEAAHTTGSTVVNACDGDDGASDGVLRLAGLDEGTYRVREPNARLLTELLVDVTPGVDRTVEFAIGFPAIDFDTGAGDQYDPHVSGPTVSYTSDFAIRSASFSSPGVSSPAGPVPDTSDLLSDVSGRTIAFSRVSTAELHRQIVVHDVTTGATTPIDSTHPANRIGAAIGGRHVAYVDFDLHPNGELVVHDLASGAATRLTTDATIDQSPQVSPDGTVVVWERCPASILNCDIMKAVRTGAGWGPPTTVSATADAEGAPDTDGTTIVFHRQAGNVSEIVAVPVTGGPGRVTATGAYSRDPAISRGHVVFDRRASSLGEADIWWWDLGTGALERVTMTDPFSETLADISVRGDGTARVVWASAETAPDQRDVQGTQFEVRVPDEVVVRVVDDASRELVPGACVRLYAVTGDGYDDQRCDGADPDVDADGVMTFTGATEGSYGLTVLSTPDGYQPGDTQAVDVVAGETVLAAPVHRRVDLRVRVAQSGAPAPPDTCLALYFHPEVGLGFDIRTACTNADGIATFDDLGSGEYRVAERGRDPRVPPYRDVTIDRSDVDVELDLGGGPPSGPQLSVEEVRQVDMVGTDSDGSTYAPGDLYLRVALRGADAQPIPNRAVLATSAGANPGSATATTDANGIATLRLTAPTHPGPYAVRAGTDTITLCDVSDQAGGDPSDQPTCDSGDLSVTTSVTWTSVVPIIDQVRQAGLLGTDPDGSTYAPGDLYLQVVMRAADGQPIPNRTVGALVTGANEGFAWGATDQDGRAELRVGSRKHPGPYAILPGADTVVVCDDTDQFLVNPAERPTCDQGEQSVTTTVTWTSVVPIIDQVRQIDSTGVDGTNIPGDLHIRVAMKTAESQPIPNRTVLATSTGANPGSAMATTDTNGIATLRLTAPTHTGPYAVRAGTDTITVCDDTDQFLVEHGQPSVCSDGEAKVTTTVTWNRRTTGARLAIHDLDGDAIVGACVRLTSAEDGSRVSRCDVASGKGADGAADGVVVIPAPGGWYDARFSELPSGLRPPNGLRLEIVDGQEYSRAVEVRRAATLEVSFPDTFGGERIAGCFSLALPDGYAPIDSACVPAGGTRRVAAVNGTAIVRPISVADGYGLPSEATLDVQAPTGAAKLPVTLQQGVRLLIVDDTGGLVAGTCWMTTTLCDRRSANGSGSGDGRVSLPLPPGGHELAAVSHPARFAPAAPVAVAVPEAVVELTVSLRRQAILTIRTVDARTGQALAGGCYEVVLPAGHAPVTGCAADTTPLRLRAVRGAIAVRQTRAPHGYLAASTVKLALTGNLTITIRNGAQ